MSLYIAGVQDSPNSCRNHYLYGIELKNRDAEKEKDWTKRDSIYNHALREMQISINLYNPYFDAYRDMGLIYYKKAGRNRLVLDSLITSITKIYKSGDSTSTTFINLNNQINDLTKEYTKDTTNAFKDYNTALKYNPRDDKTWNNKGVVIFELKRYQEALNYFNEAVKWNPRYVDALKNLGSAYGTLHQWDPAIQCFLEALKYAPTDPTVINYLGATYNYKGDKANAAIWNAKAQELQGAPKK
jgi:tetratricopeptide (TPR) repeat protein